MLKDKLPTPTSLLLPKLVQGAHIKLCQPDSKGKRNTKARGTKVLPPLQAGAPVRIQQGRTWTPAIVLEKHEAPRSFKVKTEDGQVYRRNRKFLRKSFESQPYQVVQAAPPASPSPTPEAVSSETTATQPTEPPQSTPQIPVRRTSGRLRSKPKWLDDYEP